MDQINNDALKALIEKKTITVEQALEVAMIVIKHMSYEMNPVCLCLAFGAIKDDQPADIDDETWTILLGRFISATQKTSAKNLVNHM